METPIAIAFAMQTCQSPQTSCLTLQLYCDKKHSKGHIVFGARLVIARCHSLLGIILSRIYISHYKLQGQRIHL